MNKQVSIVIFVAGIVLILMGINAYDSLGSDVSRLFRGAPTDKAMLFLIGGIVATVVGLNGLLSRK